MSDSKSFIEVQLPVSKLSKESYKERKAGQSQTLTGLGKWWGRKPLILVRATILGLLMPASEDPKKDREIYLKILMMDDIGLWLRKNKQIDKNDVYALLTDKERTLVFKNSAKLDYKPNFIEFDSQLPFIFSEDNGEPKEKKIDRYKKLKERFKKPIDLAQYLAFSKLSYDKKLTYCLRPEETELTDEREWAVINAHLKTSAKNLRELIRELGEKRFGKVPTIGDCFSGGGSIPFEAARIGCNVYASDLNPLAGLLTWAGLNILSLPNEEIEKLKEFQEKVFDEVVKQIDEWGIETNEKGWRAKYYLYCNETRCPECNTLVPLAPSWVISERNKTIAFLQFNEENKNFDILIKNDVSADEMKAANTFGTVKGNEMVCPNCKASTPITILRNDRQDEKGNMKYGLRRWEKNEFIPRKDDVYQERLYCIKYVEKFEHKTWDEFIKKPAPATDASYGKVYYVAPDENDLKREQKVIDLLKERFDEWQEKGFIPDCPIEDGYNTSQLIRERGWSYWHQLFNPRQILLHSLLLKYSIQNKNILTNDIYNLITINNICNQNSKLCYWQSYGEKSSPTFYNQSLNAMFNFSVRNINSIYNLWDFNMKNYYFPIYLLQNGINGLPLELKEGQNKAEGNQNEIEIGQNETKEGQNTTKGYEINLEGRHNEIKGDKNDLVGQTFLSVNKENYSLPNTINKEISQTGMSNLPDIGLRIKRRHLPHWQIDGSYYFITFRTIRVKILSKDEIKIVLNHIVEGNSKFYHLVSAVVLNDHVHLILKPNDNYDVSIIMKGIKGVTAHKINLHKSEKGSIWQDESFDRIIRDVNEFNEKVNYMFNNPIKRELTSNPLEYIGWYLNENYDLYDNDKVSQTFLSEKVENRMVGQTFLSVNNQNTLMSNVNIIDDSQTGMSDLPCDYNNDASEVKIELKDARTIENNCQIWITDPPYADAVNYHELSEFFLAWDKKMLKKIFPEWYTDSKRILAVQGKGESFNQSMISIYSNLAQNMPDDGMQVVMFTHQDTSVWADLTMILWSAGLQVSAAWTIATETESGGLKEGNYVKGTVLLVLRKHLGENEAFMHLLMPEIEEEVKSQIDSMKTIDDKDDPNFNDGDYLIAANVSALKVLTSYTKIAGMDIEYELKKERKSGEISEIEKTILNARQIASNYLVPRGFDSFTWKMLEAVERFYIKGIDLEKDGIYQISAYQEMARGFGVHDYKNLLSSTKANNVRLKTGNEFAGRNLNSDDKFSQTLLRNVLMALHLSVKNEEPKAGLNWFLNELEDFWGNKSSILSILEFITSTRHIENMKHWHPEAEQAGMLIELIKGHGV